MEVSSDGYQSLFSGTADCDWYCGNLKSKFVLFKRAEAFVSTDGSIIGNMHSSVYSDSDGPLHRFSKNDFVKLHIKDQRPKFGKAFKVLALKPTGDSYTKRFFLATIVSGPEEKDSRKIYKVKFIDDPSVEKEVFEELIVPPKEFWRNEKPTYGNVSEDKKDKEEKKDKKEKKEKKDKKEKKEKKEKKNKKSAKKDKNKAHHKHKHHHYNSDDSYDEYEYDSRSQITIVPIFIPGHPYGMQQQSLWSLY